MLCATVKLTSKTPTPYLKQHNIFPHPHLTSSVLCNLHLTLSDDQETADFCRDQEVT